MNFNKVEFNSDSTNVAVQYQKGTSERWVNSSLYTFSESTRNRNYQRIQNFAPQGLPKHETLKLIQRVHMLNKFHIFTYTIGFVRHISSKS